MDDNPSRNRVLTGFDPPLEIENGERSVDKGNISQPQKLNFLILRVVSKS